MQICLQSGRRSPGVSALRLRVVGHLPFEVGAGQVVGEEAVALPEERLPARGDLLLDGGLVGQHPVQAGEIRLREPLQN